MYAAIRTGHAKTGMVEELAKRLNLLAHQVAPYFQSVFGTFSALRPDRKIPIIISNAGCDDPLRCCLVRRRSFVLGASMLFAL